MKPNKIIHIGDVHIFFSKKFEAHDYVFNKLYKSLNEDNPDLIVLAGDLIDSKLKLSPEQFTLARNFLLNLSMYAPVIIILGNHDLNLQNKDRLDSISPIVHSLYNETQHPIHFFKNTGLYPLYDIDWAVWSCLDDQKAPHISNQQYTVGLYHGAVKGCISDNGFTLTEGIDIEDFKDCNIVMMADIHKQQSFRDGDIVYSGSLIQTKISEPAKGSYILWVWDGTRYNYEVKHLGNIYSVITQDVDNLDTLAVDDDNQLIVIKYDSSTMSKTDALKLKKELQSKLSNKVELKPTVKKKHKVEVKTKSDEIEQKKINLKNALSEYIAHLKLSNEDAKIVFDLDEEYGRNLDLSKDFDLGDYHIKNVKVENFLCFKAIDTSLDKNGIIGIAGKNRVGKSSIFKAIIFCLFNSSPNNNASLKKMINKHNRKDKAFVELVLEKNGEMYRIKRTITPKKADGVTIDLEFELLDDDGNVIKSLKGEKRQETEKEIQKLFGIESAFEILSMYSAQKRQVEFIDCKNSERLTLINRFIGSQSYEEKEKVVAEDLKAEKSVYQSILKDFNQSVDITLLKMNLEKYELRQDELTIDINDMKEDGTLIEYKNRHLISNYELNKKIANKHVDDPEAINEIIATYKESNVKLESEVTKLNESLQLVIAAKASEEDKFLNEYSQEISKYKINYKAIKEDEAKCAVLLNDIKRLKEQLTITTCNSCGQPISEDVIQKKKNDLANMESELITLKQKINDFNEHNDKIEEMQTRHSNYRDEIDSFEASIKNKKLKITNHSTQIDSLKFNSQLWEEVQDAKARLIELEKDYQKYISYKAQSAKLLDSLQNELGSVKTNIQLTKKEIDNYNNYFGKLKESEERLRILKLYKDIIHKDSLPLFILKTKIDDINEQVNLLINQVFDFDIEFSINEDSGELSIEFVYENDEEKNDVGFASGSETFIINLCIKVGLSQISELPKATTLFIDEGYGTLDKETMDKIPNLFAVLPEYYKNIITISHIEELKDLFEHQVRLEKRGKYTEVLD